MLWSGPRTQVIHSLDCSIATLFIAIVHPCESSSTALLPVDVELAVVVEPDGLTREEAELEEMVLWQAHDLLHRADKTNHNNATTPGGPRW